MNDLLARYKNDGFNHVEGWGINARLIDIFVELDKLQKELNISGNLVEIGVHHGKTLILLGLLKRDNESVVGIDLFEDKQELNLDRSGSGSFDALKTNLMKHAPALIMN
jgi:hypothetical protein